MKTTTINMANKINGENVFINAVWRDCTEGEIKQVFDIINKNYKG